MRSCIWRCLTPAHCAIGLITYNLAIVVWMLHSLTPSCCWQVGAIIVRDNRVVIATGYNGMVQHPQPSPDANNDLYFSWSKTDPDPLKNKNFYGTICRPIIHLFSLNKHSTNVAEMLLSIKIILWHDNQQPQLLNVGPVAALANDSVWFVRGPLAWSVCLSVGLSGWPVFDLNWSVTWFCRQALTHWCRMASKVTVSRTIDLSSLSMTVLAGVCMNCSDACWAQRVAERPGQRRVWLHHVRDAASVQRVHETHPWCRNCWGHLPRGPG